MSERAPGGDPTAEMASLSWPVAAGIISGLLLVVLGGSYVLTRAARQGDAAVLAVQATATTATAARATTTIVSTSTTPATATTSEGTRTADAITTPQGTTTGVGTKRADATTMPQGTTTAVGTKRADATTMPQGTTTSVGTNTADATTTPLGSMGPGATVGTSASSSNAGGFISASPLSAVTNVALPAQPSTPTPSGWWDASSDVPERERADVEQAYAHFWEVRTQVLLDLDPNRLTEIMAGTELSAEQKAIQDLQANGHAQRVDVEHHEWVTWATADAATVLDEYVSHTVLVDAETKEPVEDPPSALFRLAYLFRKVDGHWLVVDSVQVRYAD